MKSKILVLLILSILQFSIAYSQDNKALMLSIETGNLKKFMKEVDALEDVNILMENGLTPLTHSIVRNRFDFVEYLLCFDLDIEMEAGPVTPLMYSAQYDSRILDLLISYGADVNRSLFGRSAIWVAIMSGNQNSARILTQYGATIDLKDGPDGPYIFNHNSDTSIIVSVSVSNKLIIDTVDNNLHEIYIRTPVNDSFMFSLRKPEVEMKSIFKKPSKIFAVSDIEGNYIDFIKILRNNNIIDNNLNWSFDDGHLVLLGDMVDRGRYVTQVLWLIYKLEQEALASGGKVHYLLGNHELMIIEGDDRYVNEKYHILAYKTGKEVADLYGANTYLGEWIRTKNVIEKIGDLIFVHAGISDSLLHAELTIPQINEIFRQSINESKHNRDKDAQLIMDTYGVLWYRGLVSDYVNYEKTSLESVNRALDFYDAKNMVVGHCIVDDVTTDYENKVIYIDVDHYHNSSSGILVERNKVYKVSNSGLKEPISRK